MTELLVLLQFADGLFPSGGFAHSFGLETYAQDGRIRDRAGVEEFVVAHLEGSAGPCDAVAAALAATAGREAGPGEVAGGRDPLAAWRAIDARLQAMKWVPELGAASRQMGRQTARVAAAIASDPCVDVLARAIERGETPGHHAMVFGAALGRSGVSPHDAAAAYLHGTAALLVNAALRLLPLGQLDGQRTLAAVRPLVAELARRAFQQTACGGDGGADDGLDVLDTLWSFTPGLERAGVTHAGLERRLFRS